MNIRKIAAGTAVAALSLGTVLPAAALTVDTGLTGTTNAGTNTSSASVNGNTNIDIGIGEAASNGSSTASGNTSITGDVTATAATQNTASGNALSITRADIDSNSVDSSAWDSTRTSADVQSDTDLKAYVASQVKNDENISAVEANSTDVAVTYKQRGHFLGFIPVTVNATAMVDQNGQVSVKYPWYTFLTTTDRADLQAKLQANIDAMKNSGSISFTADTQARIVDQMRQTMNNELNASATATANADVGTSASGNY